MCVFVLESSPCKIEVQEMCAIQMVICEKSFPRKENKVKAPRQECAWCLWARASRPVRRWRKWGQTQIDDSWSNARECWKRGGILSTNERNGFHKSMEGPSKATMGRSVPGSKCQQCRAVWVETLLGLMSFYQQSRKQGVELRRRRVEECEGVKDKVWIMIQK